MKLSSCARCFGTVLLISVGCPSACGLTIGIPAARDNTMYSLGQFSNGAGPVMFAGRNGMGAYQRGLIEFDVASAIPASATVTSVSLTLFMSRTSDTDDVQVRLHRALAEWGEGASSAGGGTGPGQGGGMGAPAEPGDATWTHRIYPDDMWSTEGGDFDPNASGATSVGALEESYTWQSNAQMISDVQNWLNHPETNFGWVVLGEEASLGRSRRFDSRENPTIGNRPALQIEYTLPGPSADFTGEGDVDGEDLAIWEAAYGASDAGDTDNDGDTDGFDFLNWQQQYTGPPMLRAVPEPGSFALLLAGSCALLPCQRRKQFLGARAQWRC